MNWQIKRSGICAQQGHCQLSRLARAVLSSLLAAALWNHSSALRRHAWGWPGLLESLLFTYWEVSCWLEIICHISVLRGQRREKWRQAPSPCIFKIYSDDFFLLPFYVPFNYFIFICDCHISPASQAGADWCCKVNGAGSRRFRNKYFLVTSPWCHSKLSFLQSEHLPWATWSIRTEATRRLVVNFLDIFVFSCQNNVNLEVRHLIWAKIIPASNETFQRSEQFSFSKQRLNK